MPHTLRKSEKTDIFVDRLSKLTLWPATTPTATAASALIFTSVSKKSFIVTSTWTFMSTFFAQPSASNDKESEVWFMDLM